MQDAFDIQVVAGDRVAARIGGKKPRVGVRRGVTTTRGEVGSSPACNLSSLRLDYLSFGSDPIGLRQPKVPLRAGDDTACEDHGDESHDGPLTGPRLPSQRPLLERGDRQSEHKTEAEKEELGRALCRLPRTRSKPKRRESVERSSNEAEDKREGLGGVPAAKHP